jgi:hypothetical protein
MRVLLHYSLNLRPDPKSPPRLAHPRTSATAAWARTFRSLLRLPLLLNERKAFKENTGRAHELGFAPQLAPR